MIQLNEKDIIRNCKNIIFNRGFEYYNKNNVSFLSVDFSKSTSFDFINIDAAVWGSYGSLYDVVISFDNLKNFKSIYCDCEYHHSTGDMCKHMVAVLLKYINDYRGKFSRQKVHLHKDSAFLTSLESALKSTAEKAPLNLQIHLDIVKSSFVDDYSISLKIGTKKLYVVKDINEFLDVMRTSMSMCFGKLFTYEPQDQYFKEIDQNIIDFLFELKDINSFYSSTPYNYRLLRGKTAILPENSFKKFLSLLHGKNFSATIYDKEYADISISTSKLPLSFKLYKDAGQFVIKNDDDLPIPLLPDHSYYLYNGLIYCPPKSQKILFKHFYTSFNQKNEIIIRENNFHQISTTIFPAISELCSDIKVHKDIKDNINTNALNCQLFLDLESKAVSAKVHFIYGSESFNPFAKDKNIGMIFRNMIGEKKIISTIEALGFNLLKSEKLYMENDDDILNLIDYDFSFLKEHCEIFYSENFKNIKIHKAAHISSSVKLNENNLLEFSFGIDGIDTSELSDLLSSLNIRKKFFRLKDGSFLNIEDSNTQAFFNDLRYLGVGNKDLKKDVILFPKYKALSMEKILNDNDLVHTEFDTFCEDLITKINKLNTSEYSCPVVLDDTLRDYQKIGYSWFKTLASCGFGGILADEMGLGKTIQAIAYVLNEVNSGCNSPSLIVSPTSLIYNWESEFKKFAPSIRTLVVNGNKKKRMDLYETLKDYDVLITSYPLIRSDIDIIQEMKFSSFFIDEAQFIKNPASQSSMAVKKVISDVKFALTGTPIENNLSELWSIFDFIMPEYLGAYSNFKKVYESPIAKDNDSSALSKLNSIIKPFVLRRHKIDVVDELPPKITKDFIVELNEPQRKIYASFVNEYTKELDSSIETVGVNQSKFKLLSILTRLRQICCDPSIFLDDYEGESSKIIALIDIVQSSLQEGHRLLIFSQFTKVLKNIAKELDGLNITHFYLDGSTPSEERLNMVNKFNAGENDIFLISLKAGGTGLNLIGADTVIHFDPWWNPAVENQATDRSHRIGQVKTVEVIRLIAKGTIEEKIAELQKKKQALFDNIVENASDTNILKSMNESDIKDLFK